MSIATTGSIVRQYMFVGTDFLKAILGIFDIMPNIANSNLPYKVNFPKREDWIQEEREPIIVNDN